MYRITTVKNIDISDDDLLRIINQRLKRVVGDVRYDIKSGKFFTYERINYTEYDEVEVSQKLLDSRKEFYAKVKKVAEIQANFAELIG